MESLVCQSYVPHWYMSTHNSLTHALHSFVQFMVNVRFLSHLLCWVQALLRGQNKLPTFNNLSCLELGLDRYAYWEEDLPKLLHSSPILENLVFPEVSG